MCSLALASSPKNRYVLGVAPLVKENRHMLRASRRLRLAFFCSTASMLLLVVQVAPR